MKKVLLLIIGIVMIIVGWKLWDKNEGSSLKDKEEYYKVLCEKGIITKLPYKMNILIQKGK